MEMKTPGVYIVEKNAFPNSVVPVPTAVPAFIGHTWKAVDGHKSLSNKPFRISSMLEYQQYFGGPFQYILEDVDLLDSVAVLKIAWQQADAKNKETAKTALDTERRKYSCFENSDIFLRFFPAQESKYSLYYHLSLFFANGGGSCYIVSVGDYNTGFTSKAFKEGIEVLEQEREPTMLVIPEAVNLSEAEFKTLNETSLEHCGKATRNKIAILDVYDGYKLRKNTEADVIKKFRELSSDYLSYGAAYYPWLETSFNDIKGHVPDYTQVYEGLLHIFYGQFGKDYSDNGHDLRRFELHYQCQLIDDDGSKIGDDEKDTAKNLCRIAIGKEDPETMNEAKKVNTSPTDEQIASAAKKILLPLSSAEKAALVEALLPHSHWWKTVLESFRKEKTFTHLRFLPPSAAIAGIYAKTDDVRGVWKAPANVSVNSIIGPSVQVTEKEQEDLNMPPDGKAVNTVRSFAGGGTKVWGARTLNGNSQDWRYVNVRRTMMFLEQSIKNAASVYVFEPNDTTTWLNMKCAIDNFLHDVWRQGGLAGASPEDAYSVHIGLGDTMTAQDILSGIVRIIVLVAVSHPAEFIEITFQQQMQKS